MTLFASEALDEASLTHSVLIGDGTGGDGTGHEVLSLQVGDKDFEYTLTYTVQADDNTQDVSLTVRSSDGITDVSGNPLDETALLTYDIALDGILPSVTTFAPVPVVRRIGNSETHTITFSEPVVGLDARAFAASTGASVTKVTDSGDQTTYTIDFTPTAADFTLMLAMNSVTDTAVDGVSDIGDDDQGLGNRGPTTVASARGSASIVDSSAPLIALTMDTGVSSDDRITRNPRVEVTLASDATAWKYTTDGDTTAFIDGTIGRLFFDLPTERDYAADDVQVVQIQSGADSDPARLGTATWDMTAAMVVTFVDPIPDSNPARFIGDTTQTHRITFSEAVTGLTAQDFSESTGASVYNVSGSGTDYRVHYIPTETSFTLTLAANSLHDIAGNPSPASAQSASGSALPSASTVADLSSLTITQQTSGAATRAGTLSPTFAASVLGYTAEVENDVVNVRLTPTTAGDVASIIVRGIGVSSGAASPAVTLEVGENPAIAIIVTAADTTTTKTYTVTVTRAAPAAPVIALATDTGLPNDGITSNGLVNVTLAAAATAWKYSLNGGATFTPGSGTGATSFTLPEGEYDAEADDDDVQVVQTVSGVDSMPAILGPVSVDTTPPSINLRGSDSITLTVGDTYTERATVTDNIDNDVVLVASETVDTTTAATYTLTYSATDAAGNAAEQVTRTVIVNPAVGAKPVIVGSEAVSLFENTETVATYTATQDADGNPISVHWTRSGADADSFAISGDGRLGFANDPNYEDPQDTDADNVYQITVIATDSTTSVRSELEVTVTVTNDEEPGRISAITGAIQVGRELTAGTITDPDSPHPASPVTPTGWQWQDAADDSNIAAASSAPTYTLTADEVGKTLQVIVTYTDGHGPDKTVTSAPTDTVLADTETLSSDAGLTGLTLSAGAALSPAFAADIVDYTAEVGNAVTRIRVTPEYDTATVTVNMNPNRVASGRASAPIDLNVGENAIPIVVTAQDATTTKIYTVTVTRRRVYGCQSG